jgi:hypothetical protein
MRIVIVDLSLLTACNQTRYAYTILDWTGRVYRLLPNPSHLTRATPGGVLYYHGLYAVAVCNHTAME